MTESRFVPTPFLLDGVVPSGSDLALDLQYEADLWLQREKIRNDLDPEQVVTTLTRVEIGLALRLGIKLQNIRYQGLSGYVALIRADHERLIQFAESLW